MKKIVSLILVSIMIMTISFSVFATEDVLGGNSTHITDEEYQNAQKEEEEKVNKAENNVIGSLPQTGVEDYNVAILLVVFGACAIFAYKKVRDYRDI